MAQRPGVHVDHRVDRRLPLDGNLGEPSQPARRSNRGALGSFEVHLDHLGAGTLGGVVQPDRDPERHGPGPGRRDLGRTQDRVRHRCRHRSVVCPVGVGVACVVRRCQPEQGRCVDPRRIQLRLTQRQLCIAQPVAKPEQRLGPRRIEPAVADVGPLPVHHLVGFAREPAVAGHVGRPQRKALGQPAGRLGSTDQHVGQCPAGRLAAEVRAHDRARLVYPAHRHRRAGDEHDGGAGVGRAHRVHQIIVLLGQVKVDTVEALGFGGVGEPDDHDGHLGTPGDGDRLVDAPHRLALAIVAPRQHVAGRVLHPAAGWFHLQAKLIEQSVASGGLHLRATPALEARPNRKLPDEGNVGRGLQRQQPIVGQQHRPGRCGGACQPMVLIVQRRQWNPVGGVLPGAPLHVVAFHQCQHPLGAPLHLGSRQRPIIHRQAQGGIVRAVSPRHLQVLTGADAGNPVGVGAPIGHDQPLEAPLGAQDVGEQPRVLRAVHAVEPVVGRHDRRRLAASHGGLERAQIQLAQRRRVDDRIDHHAVGLLVVDRKVLQRGAHPLALHAVDPGDRQLAGEQRILGEVLEVAAGGRVALQVDRRAEHHSDAFCHRLASDRPPHLRHQLRVPGGGQGAAGRETGGRFAGLQVGQRGAVHLAQPVGTVGHHHRIETQIGRRFGVPVVGAGHHRHQHLVAQRSQRPLLPGDDG